MSASPCGSIPAAVVYRTPAWSAARSSSRLKRANTAAATTFSAWLSAEHDVAEPDAQRRRTLLLDLPGGVAQVHVADLVAQHARELIVAGGVLDQTARHVDVPARDRERVHVRGVHDPEGPGEVASRGHGDEGPDRRVERRLDGRVVDHRHGGVHRGRILLAELPLLLDRDGARRGRDEPEPAGEEGQTPAPLLRILIPHGGPRTREKTHCQ